jgi:hypothetical protein
VKGPIIDLLIFRAVRAYGDILRWMDGHLLTCPSRKYLHLDCPGCGLQRSVMALLRADLATSFRLYPPAIPLLLLCGFTLAHLKFKFTRGALIIKYLQLSVASMILVFYIYKILNHKIFA